MTKLDCKIGKSENEPNNNDNTATTESAGGNINNEQQSKKHFEDVFPTFGLNLKDDGTGPHISFNCIGMDWAFMLQVANAQALLTILLILCLVVSMLLTGYRVVSSVWATYLLSCTYVGLKAGRFQSYSYAIAYCGMCAFQSFVYMSTMCWFVYSQYIFNSSNQSYFIHTTKLDTALVFALGEVSCIVGTALTGIFGLFGCCHGFGRLLHAQEKMILDYQNVLIGAYDSARRLNTV